jgi:hypothetical protein
MSSPALSQSSNFRRKQVPWELLPALSARITLFLSAIALVAFSLRVEQSQPVRIASRRELFLDDKLIVEMEGARLAGLYPKGSFGQLHES